MRIFLTGSTGFIGSRLSRELLRRGDEVLALTRDRRRLSGGMNEGSADRERSSGAAVVDRFQVVEGDPAVAGPWQERLRGCDAVVALAGEPVMGKRWTAEVKQRIERSRVDSLLRLREALEALPAEQRPKVVVAGSAIGYYGDRGDQICTEETPPGPPEDFLAQVCVRWEEQAQALAQSGLAGNPRVVSLRIGVVLGEGGGALASMVPAFRAFVGGPLGGGGQYLSWIHLEDVVGLVQLCLDSEEARGPVNATAPEPVPMAEFARTLGEVLHRPAVLRVPGLALRLLLGEASQVLLGGQRVLPQRARALGYRFRYPHLLDALRAAIPR